uniref:NADH-ubiquinone oxidoreductase chain 4 n=1 Tax=Hydra vulgaris TaxID=6087 RepID=A0A0H5AP99_HYDVU|nr:NADH dehydrogenase subunit 4 [Hydra vulgaris]BAR90932.1 NADH dehydrogenase subunit 4 [Hydra vulgaris]
MYIIFLLLIPFLSILNILFLKRNSSNIFNISLSWSLILLLYYIVFFVLNYRIFNFQFSIDFNWLLVNSIFINWNNFTLSVDGISIFFIGLSILLIPICILISFRSIKYFKKEFNILLFISVILLIGVFSILDVLWFYILFESILIPVFIMIGIWGYREEKIKAAFYFFFYTLIGSLLMLISIFKLYSLIGTTNYENLLIIKIPYDIQFWLFIGFFIGLAVKIPMVPFHIWLPQAHVEAPIAGSILLAGILLKLGGYGLIRFCYPIFPSASQFYYPLIIIISIIAIVYGALTTCRQVDIKRLIAYSSVSHMGLVIVGIFSHSIEGLTGSILMMIAHGLSSSGLFIITSIIYFRFHSRIIKYFRGLTITMPILSIITFILILANISFPLTLNFIAELFLIISAFKFSLFIILLILLGVFINLIYSLWVYNRMFFGSNSIHLKFSRDIVNFEFQSLLPLIIFIIILGIYPNILINPITFSSYINISI